jgi:hypothetical protein
VSDKLTLKSGKCFFVGFRGKSKDIVFIIKQRAKCLTLAMGFFLEKEFLSKVVSGSKVQLEEISETPENISALTDPIQEVQDIVQ